MRKQNKKTVLMMVVIAAGLTAWAPAPGTSSEHFLVTNDNLIQGSNVGTVWKLSTGVNPSLSVVSSLPTGGTNMGIGGPGMNETFMILHGSDVCIFISDNESGDIASFLYPTYVKVGRFTLPGMVNSGYGLGLAARGEFLFANYVDNNDGVAYIATWRIGSGCMLNLANTYLPPGQVWGMAISPDGKTLVVSYGTPESTVDSFSVGPDGQLTEHGPYDYYSLYLNATGIDITEDGKYAAIGEIGYGAGYTQIGIYSINPDGSLGADHDFGNGGLGHGNTSGWVRLSPDERFLFVSSASYNPSITTLTFDESVPSVSFAGCIVRRPSSTLTDGLTTILPAGSGGYLAQSELSLTAGALALYTIDSSTGCLTQAPSSPYLLGKNSDLSSMASWPPRPF